MTRYFFAVVVGFVLLSAATEDTPHAIVAVIGALIMGERLPRKPAT